MFGLTNNTFDMKAHVKGFMKTQNFNTVYYIEIFTATGVYFAVDTIGDMFGPTNETFDMEAYVKDFMKTQNFNRWKALENDTEMEEEFYKEMDESYEASMAYATVAVGMTAEELEEFGHHKDDLILSCHYMGMACSPA